MATISDEPSRRLSLADLGLPDLARKTAPPKPPVAGSAKLSELGPNDRVLALTRRALELGYAGVILAGTPGTGKSWYAQQIAAELTGDVGAVRSTQFHPSFQYEDFVYGYRPNAQGVFETFPRIFALICIDAVKHPEREFALVIDELSRSDVVRVFGEVLTFIERSKRGAAFTTASGETMVVPKNLTLVCTMNPWDKGVDDVDMALERRFAQIDLDPDVTVLRAELEAAEADPGFIARLATFFETLQRERNERLRLGHAYFLHCVNEQAARDVWALRILPTIRRAAGHDGGVVGRLQAAWDVVAPPLPPAAAALEEEGGGAVEP